MEARGVHESRTWPKTQRSTQWTTQSRVQWEWAPCRHRWRTVSRLIRRCRLHREVCATQTHPNPEACPWLRTSLGKEASAPTTWKTWFSSTLTWPSQSNWGRKQSLPRSVNSTKNRNHIAESQARSKRHPAWHLRWETSQSVELLLATQTQRNEMKFERRSEHHR